MKCTPQLIEKYWVENSHGFASSIVRATLSSSKTHIITQIILKSVRKNKHATFQQFQKNNVKLSKNYFAFLKIGHVIFKFFIVPNVPFGN